MIVRVNIRAFGERVTADLLRRALIVVEKAIEREPNAQISIISESVAPDVVFDLQVNPSSTAETSFSRAVRDRLGA